VKPIRLATQEEIDSIQKSADLGPGCSVYALDFNEGTGIAVVRQCYEIDPMYLPGDNLGQQRQKVLFQFGLESALAMAGVPHYYFNIAAEDTQFQGLVVKTGAEQVSQSPEFRFKKVLLPYEHKEGK
jgi:hypothetical protein